VGVVLDVRLARSEVAGGAADGGAGGVSTPSQASMISGPHFCEVAGGEVAGEIRRRRSLLGGELELDGQANAKSSYTRRPLQGYPFT
jgi:hypothetical protein